jgi:hypothetical protein
MPSNEPPGYAGPSLPTSVVSMLTILERYGIAAEASTQFAGKTINLVQDGNRCGYINGSVLERSGVLGYRFAWSGRANNACPPDLADTLVPVFCGRYKCEPTDLVVHHGGGANAGRTFLIIKNPTVGLRVLLQDAGRILDETIEITKIKDLYVEGALRDVQMQRYERSSAARQACLAHYGYDCFACGANLQRRYCGLQVELIHVHHEEPLAANPGSRKVDPVAELKPVCPNCHAVIHSKSPPYSIAELRQMLRDEA